MCIESKKKTRIDTQLLYKFMCVHSDEYQIEADDLISTTNKMIKRQSISTQLIMIIYFINIAFIDIFIFSFIQSLFSISLKSLFCHSNRFIHNSNKILIFSIKLKSFDSNKSLDIRDIKILVKI